MISRLAQEMETSEPVPTPSASARNTETIALALGFTIIALTLAAGFRTWQRGHKLLFLIGFVAPVAWMLGVFLRRPKPGQWI